MSNLRKFFFGVYKNKQTYKNLIFSLTLFPIGILAYIYVVAGFFTSLALFVIFIGIPLNYYFLRSLRNCVLLVTLVSNKITGQPEMVSFETELVEGKWYQNYFIVLKMRQTWIYLIYLLGIFLFSLALFVITFGFLTVAIVLRIEPVYEFVFNGSLNEGFSISNVLPSFLQDYEIAFLSLLGSIIMTFQLHLVNFFVKSHSRLLSKLITV